ncbi:histidine phosphatase family protein [Pseudocolwellia sp. HL-MZ7]|uniref:histidine phosphatase family protein n=1 Tax=Pseudocolwellia sp. HL-MZ7 TaxID=3400627 RepID=UPI003CFB2CDF
MEIILIRHGKPTGAIYPRVNASGFANWVRKYDQSGIVTGSFPESDILSTFKGHYIVSSSLKRAIESTQICFKKMPSETSNIFRELEIPRYKLPFTLKASNWLYLNRILWTLGVKCSSESYQSAKKRAAAASEQLIKLANKHNKVVLVSHGYINFFIRRHLSKNGWHLKEQSRNYWGVTRLET